MLVIGILYIKIKNLIKFYTIISLKKMSQTSISILDKFKRIEKRHQEENSNYKIQHQYVLHTYIDGEEDIKFDDLISCLDDIPTKFKIIEEYKYAEKCYIVELMSYYIDKDKAIKQVNNFKLRFG